MHFKLELAFFLPVVCSFLLIGCSDTSPNQTSASTPAETQAVEAPERTTESKIASDTAADNTTVETPPQSTVPVAEKTEEKVVQTTPSVSKAALAKTSTEPVKPEKTVSAPSGADGSALYAQKCASCHGQKGEKTALGKSQHIGGWSPQQVKDALHGYQAGTYGKEMKAVMAAQAKALSADQVEAVSHYISTL